MEATSEALTSGGKTALKVSAVGGLGLLLYIFLTGDKVVYLPYALAGIAVVSVTLGGMVGGMTAGSMGWLHGLMIALLYVVVTTVIRFFMFPESAFDQSALIQAGALIAAGSTGGVAGINAKFVRRRRRRFLGY